MRLIVVPLGGGGLISGIAIALSRRRGWWASRAESPANTICDGIAVKKPGAVTGAAARAPRGRDRERDRRRGGRGDGAAAGALEARGGGRGRGGGGGAAARAGGAGRRTARPAPCSPAATWTPRCWRSASAWARPRPGGGWCSSTRCPTGPAALARLLDLVAEHGANVMDVEHLREGIDLHVRETAIQLVIQTRGREPRRRDPARRGRRGLLDQVRAASRRRRLKRAGAERQARAASRPSGIATPRARTRISTESSSEPRASSSAPPSAVAAGRARRRPRPRGRGSRRPRRSRCGCAARAPGRAARGSRRRSGRAGGGWPPPRCRCRRSRAGAAGCGARRGRPAGDPSADTNSWRHVLPVWLRERTSPSFARSRQRGLEVLGRDAQLEVAAARRPRPMESEERSTKPR